MEWKALRAKVEWELRGSPSKARLMIEALQAVEQGLQTLSTAGFHFHLEDGPNGVRSWNWPRRYYHYDLGWRDVLGPGHLAELGPGWYESPSEAEQAYGEAVQFAGRAGVRRWRGLRGEPNSRAPELIGRHDSTEAMRIRQEWLEGRMSRKMEG